MCLFYSFAFALAYSIVPGLKFGMMAMKVLLSIVIRKFKINCNYKNVEDIRVKSDLLLKALDGYNISVISRNTKT